ncbi:MAG: hypothetical protein E7177_06800 [Erysipelotrichaceae bacterium]|nr:hypothetical protein [Erysipelotrichaceae bacterium]
MKKKLLRILFLIIMFFGIVPATSFGNTNNDVHTVEAYDLKGRIYFDKPSDWTSGGVLLLIGHSTWSEGYTMTQLSSSSVFYYEQSSTWGGATEFAFVDYSGSAWGGTGEKIESRVNGRKNYIIKSGTYEVTNGYNFFQIDPFNTKWTDTAANVTTYWNVKLNTEAVDDRGTTKISGHRFSSGSNATTSNSSSTSIMQFTNATLTATANNGFVFDGWYDENDNLLSNNSTYVLENVDYDAHNNKTYYAKFNGVECTVNFNPGDGTVSTSSKTVNYKSPYGALPTATHNNSSYVFTGWYTAESGGTKVTEDTIYSTTSDTILYAHYEQLDSCEVTFKSFDETITSITAYETLTYGFDNPNAFNSLTKTGYTFNGWFNSSGQQITADSVVPSNPSDHTLTAKWTPITYTITYNGISGADNTINSQYDTFTIESTTFTIKAPTKEYYTFLGWSGSNGSTPQQNVTISKGSSGNKTYTANWENKVTIYWDFSGIKTWYGEEAPKAYYPFIYFWNESGNIGWNYNNGQSDSYTRFENLGNNLFKYEINFLDSKLSKLQEIDAFIFGFYFDWDGNDASHENPLQTTNINFPISYKDNGKEFRIVHEDITEDSWTKESQLNNFNLTEVTNVHYMIGNEEINSTGPIYNHYPSLSSSPIFIEKEGYKLNGWYTSPTEITENNLFTKGFSLINVPTNIYVYANYVEANDYYIYVDTLDKPWESFSVYMWSDNFSNESGGVHENNAFPGVHDPEIVTDIGNKMYKIKIDASKSYDHLIFANTANVGDEENPKQTIDLELTPDKNYYVFTTEVAKNDNKTPCYHVKYEEETDNFLHSQKNISSDINDFRFIAGFKNTTEEKAYGGAEADPSTKQFGFKFIFVKGTTSYVGYWNFKKEHKYDVIRYDGTVYPSGNELEYSEYYALSLTDDVTFKYGNYDQIIVVACYRDSDGDIQVIRAQEYNIVGTPDNVYLYEIER